MIMRKVPIKNSTVASAMALYEILGGLFFFFFFLMFFPLGVIIVSLLGILLFIYLFIFGCVGSLFLCEGFL